MASLTRDSNATPPCRVARLHRAVTAPADHLHGVYSPWFTP